MKRMIRAALLTAVWLCTALSQASAQAPGHDPSQDYKQQQFIKRFNAADTNHDGKLSRDEAKGGMPGVYKHFDSMDTDKKGFVTVDDIAAYGAARHKAKQGAADSAR